MHRVSDTLYINTNKSPFGVTSKNTADSCIQPMVSVTSICCGEEQTELGG